MICLVFFLQPHKESLYPSASSFKEVWAGRFKPGWLMAEGHCPNLVR